VKAFAELYRALDETTRTSVKVAALVRYFRHEKAADAAWAIYLLIGRKPRQVVPSRKLALWAAEAAGLPDWLFEECYHAVGDLAETMALVLPAPLRSSELPLHSWIEERLLPLRGAPETEQRQAMLQAWTELNQQERLVCNKIITGGFRVGVSAQLLTRALAEVAGRDTATVAHRLMGDWEPTAEFYAGLFAEQDAAAQVSRPYPFFLAYPLEDEPATLGPRGDWQAEWKWDGIRAQLVRRAGQSFLWSRGEELVTARYPEIVEAAGRLPDGTVIDGEILPWKDGRVGPFADLQRRIGRKTLGQKLLQEVPAALMAYDVLGHQGVDIREQPLAQRRVLLEELIEKAADPRLLASPVIDSDSWSKLEARRQESRQRHVEGLMIKRQTSPYRVGRQRGDWWKWKVNPFTIDAVLIYAQRGNGKRASLYTDYTFGLWEAGRLIPVAKAYSGLTDEEIRHVDAFVRRHTVEKFGPVRTVKPELVFELAFEGIQRSTRHKSGVAVRFPRILRWRTDKPAAEADRLENLRKMLPAE